MLRRHRDDIAACHLTWPLAGRLSTDWLEPVIGLCVAFVCVLCKKCSLQYVTYMRWELWFVDRRRRRLGGRSNESTANCTRSWWVNPTRTVRCILLERNARMSFVSQCVFLSYADESRWRVYRDCHSSSSIMSIRQRMNAAIFLLCRTVFNQSALLQLNGVRAWIRCYIWNWIELKLK